MSGTYKFQMEIPEGDERKRAVCQDCGFIAYVNPKIVVGSVCTWEDKILLCRRAIEPRHGYWTIPAGFLEEGETTEAGARREAYEEARADIDIRALLGIYSVQHISEVLLVYTAELRSPDVACGIETLETALVDYGDIPWDDLAFPSVSWALESFHTIRDKDVFAPFRFPEGT